MALTTASIENLLSTLLERFETLQMEGSSSPNERQRVPMQAEIRSLDFWRAIVAECLASFFLIFIVCGSFVPWTGHTPPAIGIALAAGFSIASLTLTFAHISGAHLNPVVSLALLVTRKVSPMKAFLYVTAQGGGAIAGAALLYGVTSAGHQGNLGATIVTPGLSDWQGLGIELCLTFVIVLVYLTSMDDHRRILPAAIGPGPLTIGLTYTACSFVALPSTGASFNPMRSLGPAFVMNKWDAHWVYWIGPIVGGCLAGILYEFIFNPYRNSLRRKESVADGDSSSIHSDEDNYDDVKSTVANYQAARSQHYDQYRPAINMGGASNPVSPNGAVGNNWRNQQRMMERAESVYGGTKSLYNAPCSLGYAGNQPAKSPGPPTQRSVGLNRSQSVYAKAPPSAQQNPSGASTRQPGLQSAQSTYLGARNVDLIRTESIYATRAAPQPIYGQQPPQQQQRRPDVEASGNMMISPRETNGIYGTSRATAAHQNSSNMQQQHQQQQQQQQHDRSQPESYQLEPIYGTRRDVVVTAASVEQTQQQQQRGNNPESLYGRNTKMLLVGSSSYNRPPTATVQDQAMETSNSSAAAAPISPSDTSKDSAYGSVHGQTQDWSNNSNHQQQPTYSGGFQPYQPPSGPMYPQRFRADLISPAGSHHHHSAGLQQSHSPSSHTPSSFHSPVQY